MAECPGCAEKIKPGVAVCKTCGAILDREKAAALGLGATAAVTSKRL
jgi:transposase